MCAELVRLGALPESCECSVGPEVAVKRTVMRYPISDAIERLQRDKRASIVRKNCLRGSATNVAGCERVEDQNRDGGRNDETAQLQSVRPKVSGISKTLQRG